MMINPSTTTITSESSSETTTVTSRSGLTSVGLGGVVFKPPGYVPPLTTPEPVTVSTPTSPVAPISADFSLSTPSVEGNLISVLNEKVIIAFENENVLLFFFFKSFNVWLLGETIGVYRSTAKQFT